MCGFVGIASPRAPRLVPREELAVMLASIAYRGPDDEGFALRPEVGFGFRRLSIVDVALGHQPMTTEDGALLLVCNGEIYNHEELRGELSSLGHSFRTRCDVEVLLHAYRAWGPSCVSRLRGIFAFAIWDAPRRELFLSRDRSGIKPLFFRASGDELHFASEAKALLVHPSCPRRLDVLSCFAIAEPDALVEGTPFAGISQVAPGSSLTFSASGLSHERYWRYAPTEADASTTEADIVTRFRDELARAVSMELMADVPVGAYLSGGLDSSVVVGLAAAHLPDLPTFTSVSPGSDDPWFSFVLSRAAPIRSRFVRVSVEGDDLDTTLTAVAWGAEGTFDLGFLARFQLASVARSEGVKVLLTGQGADELLGGYAPSYAALRRAAKQLALAATLLQRGWDDVAGALLDRDDAAAVDGAEGHDVANHLRRDHSALSHTLLRFEDRMGMLAGVEVRVPFLDHKLVELVARIPSSMRRRLFDDKLLLREAARGLVPDSVRLRAKLGFNAQLPPMSRAVLRGHETLASSLLGDQGVRDKGYFDPKIVRRLRNASNHRALDVVLIVHLLDELFVSHLDATRFATIASPHAELVTIDETSMPAAQVRLFAEVGPRASDVPVVAASVTHVGLLHPVAPAGPPMLASQHDDGRSSLVPIPAEVEADQALAIVRAADGTRTYADVAERVAAPLETVLAIAKVLLREGLLGHARPGRG